LEAGLLAIEATRCIRFAAIAGKPAPTRSVYIRSIWINTKPCRSRLAGDSGCGINAKSEGVDRFKELTFKRTKKN
jgi:hypothetical protein